MPLKIDKIDSNEYLLNGQKLELGGNTYKSYVATLSQSGLTAPIANVIYNDLGGVPVWNYSQAGSYYMELTGAFTNDKTVVLHNTTGIDEAIKIYAYFEDEDTIYYETLSGSTYTDDVFYNGNKHCIEVRVYN